MLEADWKLALKEDLQKVGKVLDTRFCRVSYLTSEVVSALLNKKVSVRLAISRLSNFFIWAAKTIEKAVVRVEIIDY